MAKNNIYLVGFTHGANQCVYGKDVYDEKYGCKVASYTDPMTLLQATRQLKKLTGKPKAIFKLVPLMTVSKPKKKKRKGV